MPAENDVTIYFRWAANRTNVFILVMFASRFLDDNSIDFREVLLLGPENGAQVDLLSSTHDIHDYFRIIVAVKSHIRVDAWAGTNVFGTSDSKHYIRRSLWDECCSVLHCPHQFVGFLVHR